DGQQLRDAALQGIVRFLIARCLGDFGDGAIEVIRDEAEFVVGLDFSARASIARREPLGELSEVLPRRHARIAATPSAINAAIITEPLAPLGKLPKSNSDTPPDSRPAWYASPSTMKSASPLTKTSVQIVE